MAERVDSKALSVTFLTKLPLLLIWGLAGAVLGSGLYLLIALFEAKTPTYTLEKEYYVTFTYDWSKDYYNDFTWNDLMSTDPILGKAMQKLSGYDRDEVAKMVEARIFSDVRYLTVQFTGTDEELIGKLAEYINEAILEYPDSVDELADIRCIEEGHVIQQKMNWFTKRAILFGFITGVIVYIFAFIWSFSLGSSFYTRYDIVERLNIDAYAVNEITKEDYVASVSDSIDVLKQHANQKIFIAIPQGKPCRQAIEDLLISAVNAGVTIEGAVLVNCSRLWLTWYGIKNYEGIYKIG